MPKQPAQKDCKVIDFFSGKPLKDLDEQRIIRIAPEYDNLSMLYSNENNGDRYSSMRILFWGLRWNGDVVGLVPWMNQLIPCPEIQDPLNGCWEGYYDAEIDNVFYDAPMHKVMELETSLAYFETHLGENEVDPEKVLQELPDNIGSHAMLLTEDHHALTLTEVLSWRLYGDGTISAMLMAPEDIHYTPVLTADECLYRADDNSQFKYFFQYHVANKIKNEDPEALKSMALLFNETGQDAQ